MALPMFVVFTGTSSILCLFKEDAEKYGLLQFSRQTMADPLAKFAVEGAQSGKGLVHIRCCYNNKYFVRESSTSDWIMARANEPEEDQSSWACTLFQPIQTSTGFQFMHVQLGRYVITHLTQPWTPNPCLRAAADTLANAQIYTIVDWETIFIMPRHVTFKGDNGKYLSVREIGGERYLQFASDDIGDPTVRFEVFLTNDGSIRIKSSHFNAFWRRNDASGFILVDADETAANTLFWVVRVGKNVVSLRQQDVNLFCERFNGSGNMADCLRASVETIAKRTRLEVEEVVISRRIDNVVYRLMDARIYGERALIVACNDAVNMTRQPRDMKLNFSYSETTRRTWNASVSAMLGITATFQAGLPVLLEKEISIQPEISAEYQWGETRETTTDQVATAYDVTVTPNSMVKVRLLATEASYDIPFSYIQHDTLVDGSVVTYEMDDGVFTGVNAYNFRYETEQQQIDDSQLMQQETSPKMGETEATVPKSA